MSIYQLINLISRLALEDNGVCIATTVNISEQPISAVENNLVIDQLLAVEGANGVILLAEPRGVNNFLEVSKPIKRINGSLISFDVVS